ncbi:ATP-binding protein [Streptomyces kronopolitis]|nr:ATP-binding protein [Streptomyces kronopolitis]
MRFAERPEDVALARALTRRFLEQTHPGHPDEQEAAVLVVSELVTNAIRHAHGSGTLTLVAHTGGLDVTVTDPSAQLPHARTPDTENGTGGWG